MRANWFSVNYSVPEVEENRLTKIQASAFDAWNYADTKNLPHVLRVGPLMWRATLRSRGSDSVTIQEISAIQFDEYQ